MQVLVSMLYINCLCTCKCFNSLIKEAPFANQVTYESKYVIYNKSNGIYIVYVMTYLPSSINIVILGSLT